MVGTLHSHCWVPGLISDWGNKSPQVTWYSQKERNLYLDLQRHEPNNSNIWQHVVTHGTKTHHNSQGSLPVQMFKGLIPPLKLEQVFCRDSP